MPEIVVNQTFKHSEDGNTITTYEKGVHVVSERCAHVAVNQLQVASLKPELETKPARKPRQTKG